MLPAPAFGQNSLVVSDFPTCILDGREYSKRLRVLNPCAPKQVLSNEAKRSVYDVYGRQGLEAGLSVVPHSSRESDKLRQQWAKFQEQQVYNPALFSSSKTSFDLLLTAIKA